MSGGGAKVWITRAQPGADVTAGRVAALGFEPIARPLLEVRQLSPTLDLEGVAALAFTSANGVRAFAALTAERSRPVVTVGEATAQAARAAGFARVASADGDVVALAAMIAAAPPDGPMLHAGARQPAGDLVGDLAARGVEMRQVAVYETVPTPAASDPTTADEAEIVLLHSPRAARLLAELLRKRPREDLAAVCLSPAVAAPLAGRRLAIAEHPDEAALLAALRSLVR